jgi:hypothetical protein
MKTIILLLFSTGALAQQTLLYTGFPINGAGIITGQVTLAQPLPSDGTVVLIPVPDPFNKGIPTPVSASFTGTLVVGTSEPSIYPGSPSFSFTTAKGVITAWHIVSENFEGNTAFTVTLDSVAGDDYNVDTQSPDCQYIPQKCHVEDYANTTPGTWSVPQAQVAPAMAKMNSDIAGMVTETNNLGQTVYQQRNEINAYQAMYVQMLGWCRKQKGVC